MRSMQGKLTDAIEQEIHNAELEGVHATNGTYANSLVIYVQHDWRTLLKIRADFQKTYWKLELHRVNRHEELEPVYTHHYIEYHAKQELQAVFRELVGALTAAADSVGVG